MKKQYQQTHQQRNSHNSKRNSYHHENSISQNKENLSNCHDYFYGHYPHLPYDHLFPHSANIRKSHQEHSVLGRSYRPNIRQSQYLGQKNQIMNNIKHCRFSEHADRIKSTNPSLNSSQQFSSSITYMNLPLTFGTIRQSKQIPVMTKENRRINDSGLEKCFNHFNKEAKYYLLLAEKEQDKTSNRLYYCEKCGMNLKNQGFVIHPLSQNSLESPVFIKKLNQCIKKIEQSIMDLAEHPYLRQIQWKANQISKKYDNIIEILLQLKKQELIQLEKYKFQVFEYVTKREKELEGGLKKLELLNQSYLKNCNFQEGNEEELEHELYWNILQKSQQILNVNINSEIKKIKLNQDKFLEEVKICENLLTTFQERVYQLSFEEDSFENSVCQPTKTINILDGLNATFGPKQNDVVSLYE